MRMLIGDRWLDKDEKIDVLDPYDGALVDTVPDGGPRTSRAPALGRGGFRTTGGARARGSRCLPGRRDRTERQESSPGPSPARSKTIREARRRPAVRRHPDHLRGGSAADRRRDRPLRQPARVGEQAGILLPLSDRDHRRHHPVQRSAQPGGPQGRAGDRRRQRGRPQAGHGHAAVGAEAGRGPDRGRAALEHPKSSGRALEDRRRPAPIRGGG